MISISCGTSSPSASASSPSRSPSESPGSRRQSQSTLARAGITFSAGERCSRVGAIVVANSGVSSSANAGFSASSSAIAESRPPSGRYPAIREIGVANLGTDPSATPGIVVAAAVPRGR